MSRGDAALLAAVGAGDVVDALPDAVVHAAASAATLDLAAAALALVAALAAADAAAEPRALPRSFFGGDRAGGAVVAALVATCLAPDRGQAPAARAELAVATQGLRALNATARLDRDALNEQVFSTTMRPQLLHLCDTLFQTLVDAAGDAPRRGAGDAPRGLAADDCLDELVELVGHFALVNQECLQWGSASRVTLLRRLLQLPFKYFSRPRHVDVLFPTLVAGCLGNDVNAAVAADDISMRAVADYLKAQLAKRDDAPESVALRGRIPEPLWDRAAAYFDRLSNTATLD